MVLHVQNGKELDRSLAFIQGVLVDLFFYRNCLITSRKARPLSPWTPQPSKQSVGLANNPFSHHPPGHPSQCSDSGVIDKPNNPFITRSQSLSSRPEEVSSKLPPLPPRKILLSASPSRHGSALPPPIPPPLKPKPVVSPLIQQSLMASKTAKVMKKAEEQLEKERVLQVLRTSAISTQSTDGSRESSPSKCVLGAMSDSSTNSRSEIEVKDNPPALPRRRSQHSPTVSTISIEQVALAAPPRSVQPTANLLDAHSKSIIDLPPPTHPDRKPPSSVSMHIDSERSFKPIYDISRHSSPTPTPLSPSSPSTLPSCSFSVDSVTPATPTQRRNRMFRSRSLHSHPTTSTTAAFPPISAAKRPPPVPPQKPPVHSKRKRPESLQLFSPSCYNGQESLGTFGGHRPMTATTPSFIEAKKSIFASSSEIPSPGQRKLNYSSQFGESHHLTAGTTIDTSTTGTIQRKLQELHLNALPVLEKARYKAEAGLSPRRGFIPSAPASSSSGVTIGAGITAGGKRGLSVSRPRGEERDGLLSSGDGKVWQDDDDDDHSATLRGKEWRTERLVLRDEMKWPPGEGWNRL